MPRIEAEINSRLQPILEKKIGIKFYNQSHPDPFINKMFEKASKSGGKQGYPDLIGYSKDQNILFIVEIKPSKTQIENAKKEAIHYIRSIIANDEINVISIAHAGDTNDYIFEAFKSKKPFSKVIALKARDYDNMRGYALQFVDNNLIDGIQSELPKLNNLMRAYVKTDKRALLFCGVLMALYDGDFGDNDFHRIYSHISPKNLPLKIYDQIGQTLEKSNLSRKKTMSFMGEFSWLKTDERLTEWAGLVEVVEIIDDIRGVIEFINVDILSDTFREMLRFATGDGQNFGQVMTPNHVAELMVELTCKMTDVKKNDTWLDISSGTGSLLLAAMKHHSAMMNSNNSELIDFKKNNLYGVEIDSAMFVFGVTNMIINGDGKSNITKGNSLLIEKLLDNHDKKINHLIINPPYSLPKDKHSNLIQNELAFLEKGISLVNKSAVIIAPMSVFRKGGIFKNQRLSILQKNSLKALIRLPKNTFGDDANIHPAIALISIGIPHDIDSEVLTFDLEDDGMVKIKNQPRKDLNNKWLSIKDNMMKNLKPKKVHSLDDWDVFFESEKDSFINKYDVKKEILQWKIGKSSKMQTNLFIESIELLKNNFGISELPFNITDSDLNRILTNTARFKLSKIFEEIGHGSRLTKQDRIQGSMPLLTASEKNNGIAEYIMIPEKSTLFLKNCITINMFGKCFYQDFDFAADDNIYVFRHKKLTRNNAVVLCAILNKTLNYSFAHQFRKQMMPKEFIELPVNSLGEIDWEWMEEFANIVLKEMNI